MHFCNYFFNSWMFWKAIVQIIAGLCLCCHFSLLLCYSFFCDSKKWKCQFLLCWFLNSIYQTFFKWMTVSFDLIKENENEANTCGNFYYNNSCRTSSIIENYLTFRPEHTFMDRYCSYKVILSITKNLDFYFI